MIEANPFDLLTQTNDRLPLSPHPSGRWVIWVLAIIFFGFFFLSLHASVQPDQPRVPQLWFFITILGIISSLLLYTALFRTTRPSTPLVYDAPKVWKQRLRALWFGIFISVLVFGSMWHQFVSKPEYSGKDKAILVVISILFSLFYWYCHRYYTRKVNDASRFGLSRIDVPDSLPARLGDTVNVSLHCGGLPDGADRFTATLRNVYEYWEIRKKQGKNKHAVRRTELLSEQRQTVFVNGSTVDFSVLIDSAGRITDYNLTKPVYWELEVMDKEAGYYARFFLEVM